MDTITRAGRYLQAHGRLIERHRFEAIFENGSAKRVLDALRCYQNADGGFGNALEPDLRGAGSQPEPVEVAFWILDSLDSVNGFADPMVIAACDYLETITAEDGGVPFVLPSVRETLHAPWWETEDEPPGSLVPTASIAGLLHKHRIDHPWLEKATEFCWTEIGRIENTNPYQARAVITFLDLVPDRERAEAEFGRLRDALLATVTFDLDAPGEVHFPLDFAPHPLRLPLFDDDVLAQHLDALLAEQSEEGGWNANWPVWTPLIEHEWGGYVTVGRLLTLRAYGRL
jgi:hypothetical protein